MKYLLAGLLVLGRGAFAADCLQNQERQNDSPSGEQIASALTANSQLDNVCAGNWRVNDPEKLNGTFNHGCKSHLPEPAPIHSNNHF